VSVAGQAALVERIAAAPPPPGPTRIEFSQLEVRFSVALAMFEHAARTAGEHQTWGRSDGSPISLVDSQLPAGICDDQAAGLLHLPLAATS
jgi:hypothetical protein